MSGPSDDRTELDAGHPQPEPAPGAAGWLATVVAGWHFPIFALSLVVGITVLSLAMLWVPVGDEGFGAFAEEFKIWCFGYDPATGRLQWGYVAGMLIRPIILATIIVGVWFRTIRDVLATNPRAVIPWVGAALVTVLLAGGLLVSLGSSVPKGELPFPAEQLRTEHTPPTFELTNQDGDPVGIQRFEGKVVLVTAVYASCGYSCPMILKQTTDAVNALSDEEREDLRVIAITLDPEHDDQQTLAELARVQGMSAPLYNLVTGDPAAVNEALDALQIARQRDPRTGVIDHANLSFLVDRRGRLAYRLTVGERQQRWLESALRVLLREG